MIRSKSGTHAIHNDDELVNIHMQNMSSKVQDVRKVSVALGSPADSGTEQQQGERADAAAVPDPDQQRRIEVSITQFAKAS